MARKPSQPGVAGCATKNRVSYRFLLASLMAFCASAAFSYFLVETLNAAGGIHKLLLSGEERVAVGADFDAQQIAFDGRARGERVPAGAVHSDSVVVRVNIGFHGRSPAGWPVCAIPGQAPGLQSRRLVSGQFIIIRDPSSGAK